MGPVHLRAIVDDIRVLEKWTDMSNNTYISTLGFLHWGAAGVEAIGDLDGQNLTHFPPQNVKYK